MSDREVGLHKFAPTSDGWLMEYISSGSFHTEVDSESVNEKIFGSQLVLFGDRVTLRLNKISFFAILTSRLNLGKN